MAEEVSFALQLKVLGSLMDVEVMHTDDRTSLVERLCQQHGIPEQYREVLYEKITTSLQRMLTKDLAVSLLDKVMRFLEKGRVPDTVMFSPEKQALKQNPGGDWKSIYESLFDRKEVGGVLQEQNNNIGKVCFPETKFANSAEVSRAASRYRPGSYGQISELGNQNQPPTAYEQYSKMPAGTRDTMHLQSGTYRQLEHIPELSVTEELTNRMPPPRRPSTNHASIGSSIRHNPTITERPGTATTNNSQLLGIRPNNKRDYKPPPTQKSYRAIVGERFSRTARTMPHHTRPEPSSKLQLASRQASTLIGGIVSNNLNTSKQLPSEDIRRNKSSERYDKRASTATESACGRLKNSSTSVAVMRRFKYLSDTDYHQSYYL